MVLNDFYYKVSCKEMFKKILKIEDLRDSELTVEVWGRQIVCKRSQWIDPVHVGHQTMLVSEAKHAYEIQ